MMRSAKSPISDLVPRLYRARWLQFRLSGEVRSRRDRGGDGGHDELSRSLLAAPGGLYRADLVDEDGERELSPSSGTLSTAATISSKITGMASNLSMVSERLIRLVITPRRVVTRSSTRTSVSATEDPRRGQRHAGQASA
jgi:hypothetical protein